MTEYCYVLDGTRPIPQGRVRVPRYGKPYYPKTSRLYRELLLATIKAAGLPPVPLSKVMVLLEIKGMRKDADPDNMAKQVLDALVTAGVIVADNWTVVRRLIIDSYPVQKKESPRLSVTVAPLSP